ncbi:MAG: hypothetical protein D6791_10825 [Chloroflexi bacterium]|nr:MAG: hypothetical protein D6791_10825 [Chloroflexota bacterium]
MGNRKTRRKTRSRDAPAEPEEPRRKAGWISPRTGIIVIAVVTLLNAANVFYGFSKSTNLTTTVGFTFLAIVTPLLAAGLVYFIRRKLAG